MQWLNGGVNGRTGVAKSITVMPGDEVTISAWCKYMNLGTVNNPSAFITSLASAFGVSASSTGEQLKIYNGLNGFVGTVSGGAYGRDTQTPPMAFATILFFDKDYNLVDAAWDRVTTTGAQTSPTTKQPPHDLVSITAKAPAAGYAYVFLSNEHPYYVDVYFDDATVSFTPSMVVQIEDYYPFGLSISGLSYSRENSTPQDFKYNGKELQDELGLGWLDYGARMYMPDVGRWGVVDPLADSARRWSPYVYAFDNPLRFIDPDGMEGVDPNKLKESASKGVEKANEVMGPLNNEGEAPAACNIGVREAVKDATGSASLFPGTSGGEVSADGQANDIGTALASGEVSDFSEFKPTSEEGKWSDIQEAANNGEVVVGVYNSKSSGSGGHIVMVVPGELGKGKSWTSGPALPSVLDTGKNSRSSSTPMSTVSGKKTVESMKFYKYTGNVQAKNK